MDLASSLTQTCGGCSVTYDAGAGDETVTISVCTDANINAWTGGWVTNCVDAGHGTSSTWGGYVGCCSAAQSSPEYTCNDVSVGSTPVAAGGHPDCCSHALQNTGGSTVAYCGE